MTPENRSTAETLIYNKGDTTFLGIYNECSRLNWES